MFTHSISMLSTSSTETPGSCTRVDSTAWLELDDWLRGKCPHTVSNKN